MSKHCTTALNPHVIHPAAATPNTLQLFPPSGVVSTTVTSTEETRYPPSVAESPASHVAIDSDPGTELSMFPCLS